MARKGSSYSQIPTLWHLGFGQPFSIMRKRKGDRRWRKVEYAALTRSSALRWERLVKAGIAQRRRDGTMEAIISFGVTSVAQIQQRITAERQARYVCSRLPFRWHAVAMDNPTQNHTGYTNGALHIVLDEALHQGRLHRTQGMALCGAPTANLWGSADNEGRVTCKRCLAMAQRLASPA